MVGFGLGKRAGRGALRLLKRPARFCRGFVSQRGMRPDVVVIVAPEGQLAPGISQTVEDLLVQVIRPPTLDRPEAEFSGFAQGDGLVTPPDFVSMIGTLLPIAPCGRSSL